MNLFKILADLEKVDPEVMDRLNHRRSALAAIGNITKKITLASAPIALGAAFNKTLAQGAGSSLNDILNYALLLERLEAAFYIQGLQAPTLTAAFSGNASLRTAIEKIRDNENAHVRLLEAALGSNAAAAPRGFNFTAAYANLPTFLTFAQAFEDLGVRAYKGQAPNIPRTASATIPSVQVTNGGTTSTVNIGTFNVLTVALQIHSTEARHAAHIRYLRRQTALGSGGSANNQFGWVTLDQANGAPAAVYGPGNAALFPSEANTSQAGTNLTSLTATPAYTAAEVSEAFDEALDSATVRSIASSFIIP